MARNQENIEAKLAAYVDGDITPEERQEIEAHLQSNPAHRKLLAELGQTRDLLRALPHASAPVEIIDGFQAQLERTALLERETDDDGDDRTIPYRMPRLFAMAAVFLMAVGLGALVYHVLPSSNQQKKLAVVTDDGGPGASGNATARMPTVPAGAGSAGSPSTPLSGVPSTPAAAPTAVALAPAPPAAPSGTDGLDAAKSKGESTLAGGAGPGTMSKSAAAPVNSTLGDTHGGSSDFGASKDRVVSGSINAVVETPLNEASTRGTVNSFLKIDPAAAKASEEPTTVVVVDARDPAAANEDVTSYFRQNNISYESLADSASRSDGSNFNHLNVGGLIPQASTQALNLAATTQPSINQYNNLDRSYPLMAKSSTTAQNSNGNTGDLTNNNTDVPTGGGVGGGAGGGAAAGANNNLTITSNGAAANGTGGRANNYIAPDPASGTGGNNSYLNNGANTATAPTSNGSQSPGIDAVSNTGNRANADNGAMNQAQNGAPAAAAAQANGPSWYQDNEGHLYYGRPVEAAKREAGHAKTDSRKDADNHPAEAQQAGVDQTSQELVATGANTFRARMNRKQILALNEQVGRRDGQRAEIRADGLGTLAATGSTPAAAAISGGPAIAKAMWKDSQVLQPEPESIARANIDATKEIEKKAAARAIDEQQSRMARSPQGGAIADKSVPARSSGGGVEQSRKLRMATAEPVDTAQKAPHQMSEKPAATAPAGEGQFAGAEKVLERAKQVDIADGDVVRSVLIVVNPVNPFPATAPAAGAAIPPTTAPATRPAGR